ncbi:hypothetical protein LTR53_003495 [Teratosphaeriaceae sp. CCFEE 6253]|nr:hypothetical protein LTR53_003495 [Teratosphaeriaceae sp. CCFEE 6253]
MSTNTSRTAFEAPGTGSTGASVSDIPRTTAASLGTSGNSLQVPRPLRLKRKKSASNSLRPTTPRRAADKYTQVAAELPGRLYDASMADIEMPLYVQHALQGLQSWILEDPRENVAKLAKQLRTADELTPINLTSQQQIGLNMAAEDLDGHVKRHDKEPEVMRALGACVVKAWEDHGHGVSDSESIPGIKCCTLM